MCVYEFNEFVEAFNFKIVVVTFVIGFTIRYG